MKKCFFALILAFLVISAVFSENGRTVSLGLHFLAGGRYDNVRMCVGSDEGVKGGPIMDIYADLRIPVGNSDYLAVNLPVMRPVLFGAVFKMLQFEPQITYEHHSDVDGSSHSVLGAGTGLVFHYGPDYKSSRENRGDDFFAFGPLFSGFIGREFQGDKNSWMPGIKVFYSPLFSDEYDNGSVLGAAVEIHYFD